MATLGFLGGIKNKLGDAVGAVEHGLGKVADVTGLDTAAHAVSQLVQPVVTGLNYVPDKAQQWYRAERLAEQENGSNLFSQLRGDLNFWRDPAKYWSRAEDGQTVYDSTALERIQAKTDPRLFSLAKLKSDGNDQAIADALRRLGDTDANGYAEMARTLQSPEFKDLVDELHDAHISFGRDIARTLGIHHGSNAFNIVSGTVDGGLRLLEDPLTYVPFGQVKYGKYAVAGSVGSRAAVMSDPVAAAARLDQLFQNPAVLRGTNEIGGLLARVRDVSTPAARETSAWALDTLKGRYGQWASGPMLDSLLESNVKDAASFRAWLDDSQAMSFLIRGQSAQRVKILPYRTARQAWVDSLPFSGKARWIEEGGKHKALVQAASTGLFRTGGDVAAMSEGEQSALTQAVQAASGDTLRGKAATVVRRTKTRLPYIDKNTGGFAVAGHGSIDNFNALASSLVPKFLADRLTPMYAAADVAGRKQILKGLMDTTIRAYGLDNDATSREVAQRLLRSFEDSTKPSTYTLAGAKTSLGDEAAVYAHQMSEYVYLPNFKEFASALAKVGHANGLLNTANHPAVDWFTQRVWRPAILLRPALAYRNATEETLNNFLRNGMLGPDGMFAQWAGKAVAHQGMRDVRDAAPAEIRDQLPRGLDPDAGRMWRAAFFGARPIHAAAKAAKVPDNVLRKLDAKNWASAADVVQARWLSKLGTKYLSKIDPESLGHLEQLAKYPRAADIMAEEVMGGARRAAQLQTDATDMNSLLRKRDGQWIQMRFVNDGRRRLNTAEDHGLNAWSIKLQELADEPAAAEALRWADSPEVARAKVMAVHRSLPVYENARWKAEPEEWARVVVQDVRDHLSNNAGQFNADLWRSIVKDRQIDRRELDVDRLAEKTADVTARPAFVIAPERGLLVEAGPVNPLVPIVEGAWKLSGDVEAVIARNHQMVGHYIAARKDLARAESLYAEEVRAARASGKVAAVPQFSAAGEKLKAKDSVKPGQVQARYEEPSGDALEDLNRRFDIYPRPLDEGTPEEVAAAEFTRRAWDDALARTLDYVDNPDVRSQAAVLLRNVGPFYRAQEEFYRRWFNIARYSPKSVWRAHLAMDSADDGGLVQDDPVTGQKVFVYPGTGALAQLMTDLGRKIGFDMQFVVAPGNLTGRLQTLAPGFDMDQNLHPFSGPVLALPLQAVETLTGAAPAQWAEKALLSRYGYEQKPIYGVVPSWVKTFFPNSASQAAATKQAIAALAMGGITLPESAGAEEQQEYWRLVKMHAKAIQITKAVFGTTLPSFPRITNDVQASEAGKAMGFSSFTDEFRDIATRYGYQQAYGLYASLYPTRIPLLVGKEEYAAGVVPPVSAGAAQFMQDHAEVLKAFPKAAAYLVPVDGGEFDSDAWSMARGLGMFTDKTAEQYASDIGSLAARQAYYSQRDEYEKYRARATAAGDTQGGQVLDAAWRQWSTQYLALHPLVADYLAQGGTRQQERKDILAQLHAAAADPRTPAGAELTTLRGVLAAHDQLLQIRAQYPGSTDRDQMVRADARAEFTKWLAKLGESDTTAARLYAGVFRALEGGD